jgi:hypothetical protein
MSSSTRMPMVSLPLVLSSLTVVPMTQVSNSSKRIYDCLAHPLFSPLYIMKKRARSLALGQVVVLVLEVLMEIMGSSCQHYRTHDRQFFKKK